jgi:hypothetical protein
MEARSDVAFVELSGRWDTGLRDLDFVPSMVGSERDMTEVEVRKCLTTQRSST